MGRFMRRLLVAGVFAMTVAGSATPAFAQAARPVTPPAGTYHVPAYRPLSTAPHLVVCKPGSAATGPAAQLAAECRYHDIQQAVDAVRQSGTTIYVLPGTYRETPSLARPTAACRALADSPNLTYDQERACPHLRNLIGVFGLADLQIEGVGPGVVIEGGQRVGIHADRANGLYLKNITLRGFQADGVDVVETDGFVLDQVTADRNGARGLAAIASDHGLLTDCAATGNGDAGIATASASDLRGSRLSVEVRRCRSRGNLIGFSGSAGDSVYVHDNEFSGNSTGAMLDSATKAAGMPQNHAMFVANQVFGNNADPYNGCAKRCPAQAVPVGTGMLLAGGDENTYAGNFIYDNWRYGVAQYWVPASRRGEYDPAKQRDTSHGNRYVGNLMGITPAGKPLPNGLDFWWDEQGDRNCWQSNASSWGVPRTDPATLPTCDRPPPPGPFAQQGNPAKTTIVSACSAYAGKGREPNGCTWLARPQRPAS